MLHNSKNYYALPVLLSSQVHLGSFGGLKIDHVGSKLAHLDLCCSSCQHLLNKMPQDAPTYPNLTPKMEPRCPNIAQLGSPNPPKIDQKSIKKVHGIWMIFYIDFLSICDRFLDQKSIRNRPQNNKKSTCSKFQKLAFRSRRPSKIACSELPTSTKIR